MLDTLQFNFDIFIYFHLNHLEFTTLFYLFCKHRGQCKSLYTIIGNYWLLSYELSCAVSLRGQIPGRDSFRKPVWICSGK